MHGPIRLWSKLRVAVGDEANGRTGGNGAAALAERDAKIRELRQRARPRLDCWTPQSFVRTRTHRAEKGILSNAPGRSRGGFSTELHAVVDTHGRPLHIQIMPGQQHESTIAEELLEHAQGNAVIADTGYWSGHVLAGS
jgi:hypothetical protein